MPSKKLTVEASNVLAYSDMVWNTHSTLRNRIDQVRNTIRQRMQKDLDELKVKNMVTALSSRGLAIIFQCRAFEETATYKYTVLPFDDSVEEDRHTAQLSKWLGGVRDALTETVGFPYSEFFWHYFESGRGVLKMVFDDRRAANNMFPFVVKAIDPYNVALLRAEAGVFYAVERERMMASIIYDDLAAIRAQATNPRWNIPPDLRLIALKNPTTQVIVQRCYDKENEWLFVNRELVWKRPHFMGRCPFVVAHCVDIPSDLPEEQGMGVAFPIITMLEQESQLFDKYATDAEVGARPLAIVQWADNKITIEQLYPGAKFPGAKAVTPVNYNPNQDLLKNLIDMADQDIQRMTLPSVAFGPLAVHLSGFAYVQAMSGLNARIKYFSERPAAVLSQHFGHILERVEYFATPEMAHELAGDDWQNYMQSFTVLNIADPTAQKKSLMALKAQDVAGHYRVRVELEADLPSDENAKVQRVQALLGAQYPWEWTMRNVLQPERPEEVIEERNVDLLMAQNQEFHDFKMQEMLDQYMERHKDEAKKFDQYIQTVQQSQQQAAQMMGAGLGGGPEEGGEGGEPTPPPGGPAGLQTAPQGAAESAAATAAAAGAPPGSASLPFAMNRAQGGYEELVPPEMLGKGPVNPRGMR